MFSSSTNHTAASQASTTSTRGPCKGILIGSDFALALEFFPGPSPLVDEDEGEQVRRFRFSNALCSVRARCLSATGARMIRAHSSASASSAFPCNVGAGAGEEGAVAASTRADVDVDANADPDPDPEAHRDVDGESGSNKVDPGTVRIGATTEAGGEGGGEREEVGGGGGSMASFPLYPILWPFVPEARARE